MPYSLFFIALVSIVISALCLPSLWRQPCGFLRKLLWTMILAVPVAGPVFYGGFFSVPTVKPAAEQAPINDYVLFG